MSVLFFQAEDGIRYLVRSRGLGDVYKRQVLKRRLDDRLNEKLREARMEVDRIVGRLRERASVLAEQAEPVSYTHLTLPTSDLV